MAHILLIEDEPELGRLVRGALEEAGFRVTLARDGPTGVVLAQQEQPDLIILDLMLPRMDRARRSPTPPPRISHPGNHSHRTK